MTLIANNGRRIICGCRRWRVKAFVPENLIKAMQIEDEIREFVLQNLYFSEDNSIGDEDSFLKTGVIDSMGVMELVSFVQSRFGISVAPAEVVVENFDSVRQLAAFIRRKLPAKLSRSAARAVISSPARLGEQRAGVPQIIV